jgi:hypothetical protein
LITETEILNINKNNEINILTPILLTRYIAPN